MAQCQRGLEFFKQALQKIILTILRVYQLTLSPFLGQHCRFYPSCSSYAIEAFQTCSIWKATFLTGKRICSCRPGHPGGYDPVPCNLSVHKDKGIYVD